MMAENPTGSLDVDIEIADNIRVNELISNNNILQNNRNIIHKYKNKIIITLGFLLSCSCGYIIYFHNEEIKKGFIKLSEL